jgi:4-amino-4-deoxy-L-arabinose transferase-like glycosyltransferase
MASSEWKKWILVTVLAVLTALPQLMMLPALDRDEARFAQASRQMIQSGDLVDIRFQDTPRYKKPVGIHWAQAAVVSALPDGAINDIRAYRIPSILGAVLAAGALMWGLSGLIPSGVTVLAGVLLATSLTMGIEGAVAKTDGLLMGVSTLALAAIMRLYMGHGTRRAAWVFWLAMGCALLIKGPVTPAMAAVMVGILLLTDHNRAWIRALWVPGAILSLLLIVMPWALLITQKTHGLFWHDAIAGDLTPKLAGGHERHGGPFGLHSLILPFGLWPASVLLPAGLWFGWVHRREPLVRALLAWGIGGLLIFELTPTKLAHYALPTYGAFVALSVLGLGQMARATRWMGAVILAVGTGLMAVLMVVAAQTYHGDAHTAVICAGVTTGIGGVAVWAWLRQRTWSTAVVALALVTHFGLALTAAELRDLWLAPRMKEALHTAGWTPSTPVASLGYSEPSLVFALGRDLVLAPAPEAAAVLAKGGYVWASDAQDTALRTAVHTPITPLAHISGYNYSKGDPITLTLYKAAP